MSNRLIIMYMTFCYCTVFTLTLFLRKMLLKKHISNKILQHIL